MEWEVYVGLLSVFTVKLPTVWGLVLRDRGGRERKREKRGVREGGGRGVEERHTERRKRQVKKVMKEKKERNKRGER